MSCRCAICRGDHLTKDHEYPELTLRPYPDDIQDCYNAFAEWNEFGGSKSGGRSLPEHIAIRVALAARRKAAAIPRSVLARTGSELDDVIEEELEAGGQQ